MKRARDSSLPETRMIGPSITDLPRAVFDEILLKLPVKSIVMCGLISDPQFTKLHLARARSCVLIRGYECWKFSRSLYLLEPGDERGLYSGYCSCSGRKKRCENCVTDEEVKFKLKIPVRNAQLMLDRIAARNDPDAVFSIGTSMLHKRSVGMSSQVDHCYRVVNSCHGFLCLTSNQPCFPSVCVCNPVTGEFTCPPDGRGQENDPVLFGVIGFGFSPKHNLYKVMRMSMYRVDIQGRCAEAVEIHTLGSDSWRSLDISGFKTPARCSPWYLNGALYWTCHKDKKRHLASFDFDEEQFHSFPILLSPDTCLDLGLKILEGRLILYTTETDSVIDIWALNECGDSFSCTKMYSIDFSEYHNHNHYRVRYPYQPVCCLTEEVVVLFGGPHKEFIHYDRTKGLRLKRPKFQGYKSKWNKFKVIDFTPSFVSLKDIVSTGSNVEVLNVNSRCGKIKLLEETYPLMLLQVR